MFLRTNYIQVPSLPQGQDSLSTCFPTQLDLSEAEEATAGWSWLQPSGRARMYMLSTGQRRQRWRWNDRLSSSSPLTSITPSKCLPLAAPGTLGPATWAAATSLLAASVSHLRKHTDCNTTRPSASDEPNDNARDSDPGSSDDSDYDLDSHDDYLLTCCVQVLCPPAACLGFAC